MKNTLKWWVWGLLLLAGAAYFLPWVWNPAAALAPNARDLAEWTTLHPAVRQSTPPLLPSLLLRASLGILAVIIVLKSSPTSSKWIGRILALGLILIMLPPADFFLSARGDINYRQQFHLSILTLVLVMVATVGVNRLPTQVQRIPGILFASLGVLVGLEGMLQGMGMVSTLGVDFTTGVGGIMFCCILFILGAEDVFGLAIQLKKQG